MNKFRLAFAATSVVFLMVLAVSPLKDFFAEWRGYQRRYNQFVGTLPQRVSPVQAGIKQIWAQKLGHVDRCTTCHLGTPDKALANAPEPFRTHPKVYHDPEDFGCTICHGGQGSATTTMAAHGEVEFWERPLLPEQYIEASCGQCHKEDNVAQAPVLTEGRQLIQTYNCRGCHKIEGYTKQWVPDLDGIGSKVNRSWLVQWLKHPKGYFAGAKMPNFLLSDEDANVLADFLMTFKAFAADAQLIPLPRSLAAANASEQTRMVSLGETRFREARCISCHPISGRGGYVAPDLGKVASKVSEEWLYNYVKEPKRLQPDVEMPQYGFDEKDLEAVVAYMESEFVDFASEQQPPHVPEPAFYEKGLALFKKYNCAGCHSLSGIHHAEEMGPDLSFVGSKSLYEIDFGKSDIEQTLPSYISTKLRHPRVFSPEMKMPDFEFTDEQVQAITVALLSNSSDPLVGQFKIPPTPKSAFAPQGGFGKLAGKLACFGCHTMFGRGGKVAPDLTLEASRAQKKWIEAYFKIPYSLRPILTERMPNLFLSKEDIGVLVDYMEKVFVADSIERDIPVTPEAVARGKALYYDKYGCQSCHQLNLKGGYVGPPLDNVGNRLTPGWIYHWLMNPQQYVPETIEPRSGMSEADAEQIVAFLMNQKNSKAQ